MMKLGGDHDNTITMATITFPFAHSQFLLPNILRNCRGYVYLCNG